jgi:hypothetical protein
MNDLNEKYPEEILPEEQLIEFEPDKEIVDGIVPLIDIEAIAKEERNRLFNPPVAEA